jgi:hypothetical protein
MPEVKRKWRGAALRAIQYQVTRYYSAGLAKANPAPRITLPANAGLNGPTPAIPAKLCAGVCWGPSAKMTDCRDQSVIPHRLQE